MTRANAPHFLYVQIPATVDSTAYLTGAGPLLENEGGILLAAADAREVECLERGTPEAAVLLAQFSDPGSLRTFWEHAEHQELLNPLRSAPGLLALQIPGLPYTGLPEAPDIPTIASVQPPNDRGPRAFMVVQGTGTDPERMDRYREVILPMIAEQGAYYTAFEISGEAKVLLGQWPWGIFAISRWPDHSAGHAFWDSERYQTVAIPIRTGAGTFHVHYLVGSAG